MFTALATSYFVLLYCCATSDILTIPSQQCLLFFIVVVISGQWSDERLKDNWSSGFYFNKQSNLKKYTHKTTQVFSSFKCHPKANPCQSSRKVNVVYHIRAIDIQFSEEYHVFVVSLKYASCLYVHVNKTP